MEWNVNRYGAYIITRKVWDGMWTEYGVHVTGCEMECGHGMVSSNRDGTEWNVDWYGI